MGIDSFLASITKSQAKHDVERGKEVCCECGGSPTLYYSNGKVFCGKHKAEATYLARVGLTQYHRTKDAENVVSNFHRDHSSSVNLGKRPLKDGKTPRTSGR